MSKNTRKSTVITSADIMPNSHTRTADVFPSDHVVYIRTLDEVLALFSYLQLFYRKRPLVLVTVPNRAKRPIVDPEKIRAEFDVDVAVITDPGWLNNRFTYRIGKARSAFNGASRIYPSECNCFEGDPALSKLLLNTPNRNRKQYELTLYRLIREQTTREQLSRSRQAVGVATVHADATNGTTTSQATTNIGSVASASAVGIDDSHPIWNGAPCDEGDGLVHIALEDDIDVFAKWLMSDRRLPTVVATRRSNPRTCAIDTVDLAEQLKGYASVVEVENPRAVWRLSALLPTDTHPYGGALRLYSASRNWADNPYLLWGPYTAYTEKGGLAVLPIIVDDAISMFVKQYASSAIPTRSQSMVTATVLGTCSGRGIARYGGDLISIALPEETQELPAERVLAKGQKVRGVFDPKLRILTGLTIQDGWHAIASYRDGQTVLGRVDKVRQDYCRVSLYPGMPVTVRIEDAYGSRLDGDDMRMMLEVHSVIPLRIIHRGKTDTDWTISFQNLDMDHIQPAPALIEGGPSWLQPQDQRPAEEISIAQSAVRIDKDSDIRSLIPESADPSSADMIMMLADQIRDMQNLNDTLKQSKAKLTRQRKNDQCKIRDLRLKIANLDGRYRTMRKDVYGTALFDDDAERFRCESARFDAWIREAWATGLSIGDKKRLPLPLTWKYTREFFDTLADTPVDRNLVVQAAVDVLTGRAKSLEGYQLHRKRAGKRGSDYERGPNGETVWRLYLNHRTAAARRMHYYEGDNGLITFTFVGLHDDGIRK
ncbi:hypothetical protein EP30_10145 [Bifidobacterium sp. UTCIF-39]|uniref:hypothetical protein n=1 Tax=Bifidobacterium sp. UTCIF-39 TaxID=1465359 RepID=UPI00112DD770|nr:hypothetical protein [Bifidobacterium sp. UTCIF-39]TPF95876.1 hypothetical protein EP30_10145 [Bifidobacterium sp. UTCIF-39]